MSHSTYNLDITSEKSFQQIRTTQLEIEIDFLIEMRHETIHKPEILILYMEPKKFQVPGYDLTLRFFNFLQLQEVIVKGNLQFVQKMKLWGLEKLQKLLLLKVLFTNVTKTHN